MVTIQEVTPQTAREIIDTREPLGLFYCCENGAWIGIDNSLGDAWTAKFKTKEECIEWLGAYPEPVIHVPYIFNFPETKFARENTFEDS